MSEKIKGNDTSPRAEHKPMTRKAATKAFVRRLELAEQQARLLERIIGTRTPETVGR